MQEQSTRRPRRKTTVRQCWLPIDAAPPKVREHGLRDAHSRPLVSMGKRGGRFAASFRVAPWAAWHFPSLELRAENTYPALILDLDGRGSYERVLEEVRLSRVGALNWGAENLGTGGVHLVWTLERPVHRGETALEAPLKLFARISEYYAWCLRLTKVTDAGEIEHEHHRNRRRPSEGLSTAASELAAASLSASTRRAYQGALQRLADALGTTPLTDSSLAEYLAGLHQDGKAPATLSMTVAAVKFHARTTGAPSPVGPATERVLAGARQQGKSRGRGQVKGLRWRDADTLAACAANGGSSLAGLRDAALVAVLSDGLLRVSELGALQVNDLEVEADGSGRLHVRRSKTDQEGEGAVLYVGAPTVRRVRSWTEKAGIDNGPLFRRVFKGKSVGEKALSSQAVRAIVKKWAASMGLDAGRISSHSLRVGSAQSLAARGAGLVELQQAGRWSSPSMPGHYARAQLAGRGAVARLRYGS